MSSVDLSKSQMNQDNLNERREKMTIINQKLLTLTTTQESIDDSSDYIYSVLKEYRDLVPDFLTLWSSYTLKEKDKRISLIYLANDLIKRTFTLKNKENELKLYNDFYPKIVEIFPDIYSSLSSPLQEQIKFLLKIWSDERIYTEKQIKEINFRINLLTEPEINGTEEENEILLSQIVQGKIKIDEDLVEYNKELENLKGDTKDNKNVENVLKMTKDIITKQNKVYFTHLYYIQVLDGLLDKIKTYQNFYNSSKEKNNSNNSNNVGVEEGDGNKEEDVEMK